MPAATFFWKSFATAVFLWLVFFGSYELATNAQLSALALLLGVLGALSLIVAILAFICAVIATIWKHP
ncbi:MAG: hypothetical protein QOC72_1265 [Methylobacteriaceae bacterium]|jgi:hypothetical protein|nr:hypothetical protein [Methylobacteriaceae bacterium]